MRIRILLIVLAMALAGCDDGGGEGTTFNNSTNVSNTGNTGNTNNTSNTGNVNNSSQTGGDIVAEYGEAEQRGRVSYAGITEASGIAFSRVNPDLIWIHNDSGDGPKIYAVNLAGEYLGHLSLSGVWAEDWEDIAVGDHEGVPSIFVGDFGDNPESRSAYQIHIIPEPTVDATAGFGELEVTAFTTWEFDYGADGSRNCEAMLVDPDGRVFLVEKALGSSAGLWRLTSSAPTEAAYVGEIPFGQSELITGGDMYEEGLFVVLSTYSRIILFVLPEGQGAEDLVDAEIYNSYPVNLFQLEAVAMEPETTDIWFISEGEDQRLYAFPRIWLTALN